MLLARRLVEAGTRLVQVNWPREGVKEVGGSPLWDTHRNNAGRVRDVLCPQFDRTYATLIEDLAARGLLDETLVVVMGEFGRSPKINAGQIIGATNARGEHPIERQLSPNDLWATVYRHLGIDYDDSYPDHQGRPMPILPFGAPIEEILPVS